MDNMERIIIGHRDELDAAPVPTGSKERFMSKINEKKRRQRTRIITLTLTSMAAACTAILIALSTPDITRELQQHHIRLAEKEIQIIEIAEKQFPEEMDLIIGTAKSITGDTIALEDLLPEEISEKERSRILREYYETKLSALEMLIAQYTE